MTNTKQWAQKITNAWQKSIDAIFECGRLLIEAKRKLKHGEFQNMIEQSLPFKQRTAEMLMKIAADKRLIKAKRASVLPANWYTLYRLTTLSDTDFQAALDDGTIHPEMTRDDIPERVQVVTVEKSEAPVKVVVPSYVIKESVPARVPLGGYIAEDDGYVPRFSDTTDVDVRTERSIEALEQLAELADPAVVDGLIEALCELDPERLFRVRGAIHAISKIEAVLKSRLS